MLQARIAVTRLIAVFNKDGRDAEVTIIDPNADSRRATVARLESSKIDAKDGVRFQGGTVKSDGQFHGRADEPIKSQSGKLLVKVPAYSAALIRLG